MVVYDGTFEPKAEDMTECMSTLYLHVHRKSGLDQRYSELRLSGKRVQLISLPSGPITSLVSFGYAQSI
jgi:hypothetical protein